MEINDSAAMFHSLSDTQAAGGLGEHIEMDYSHPHHFAHAFASSLFEYNYENDEAAQRFMHDDSASLGHESPHEDSQLFSTQDTWNLTLDTTNLVEAEYNQIFHIYSPPVSPSHTEVSQVSQPAYYSVNEQEINIQDSFHPSSPPLNDQDLSRTIRPTRQSQRPLPSASTSRPTSNFDPEADTLPTGESVRRAKDKTEVRTPRDHPYYLLSTQSDGKYYCPFATGENPCNHTPTSQKCAYHKYLDSHLKPYRCKMATCAAQNLRFSSNACLFRHEREAHGYHGHGNNPHLCFYPGCERAVPGSGFPRRWNLFDHMKRVHDHTGSDQPSSPEFNAIGQLLKKKDSAGVRKRKKRIKSATSQSNAVKVNPAQHEQRLQNAEQNYYDCRTRLLKRLASIKPEDTVMHENANARLQELTTLSLNYRQLKASSAATTYSNV